MAHVTNVNLFKDQSKWQAGHDPLPTSGDATLNIFSNGAALTDISSCSLLYHSAPSAKSDTSEKLFCSIIVSLPCLLF